jgi:hypothetical protein
MPSTLSQAGANIIGGHKTQEPYTITDAHLEKIRRSVFRNSSDEEDTSTDSDELSDEDEKASKEPQ